MNIPTISTTGRQSAPCSYTARTIRRASLRDFTAELNDVPVKSAKSPKSGNYVKRLPAKQFQHLVDSWHEGKACAMTRCPNLVDFSGC